MFGLKQSRNLSFFCLLTCFHRLRLVVFCCGQCWRHIILKVRLWWYWNLSIPDDPLGHFEVEIGGDLLAQKESEDQKWCRFVRRHVLCGRKLGRTSRHVYTQNRCTPAYVVAYTQRRETDQAKHMYPHHSLLFQRDLEPLFAQCKRLLLRC